MSELDRYSSKSSQHGILALALTLLLVTFPLCAVAANNWGGGTQWTSSYGAAWQAFVDYQTAHYGPCGGWQPVEKGIRSQTPAQTEYGWDWARDDPTCSGQVTDDGGPAISNFVCSAGYEWDDTSHSCVVGYFLGHAPPADSNGCGCSGSAQQGIPKAGEPINPANGNETESETDYQTGDGRLRLSRVYNSSNGVNGAFGQNWQFNFAARVGRVQDLISTGSGARLVGQISGTPQDACVTGWAQIAPGIKSIPNASSLTASYSGGVCQLSNGQSLPVFSTAAGSAWLGPSSTAQVGVQRPNGSVYVFQCTAGTCTTDPDVPLKLTASSGGYILVNEQDDTETYGGDGLLQLITYRGGYQQTFAYTNGKLTSVTDSFGRSLSFDYGAGSTIQSVTTPSGQIQYGYDAARLVSVRQADGTTRKYEYGDARFPTALTGLIDEQGVRYQFWSYDTQGRAYTNGFAGGTRFISIDYTDPNNPVVTDALGTRRTYQLQWVNKRQKVTSLAGPPCDDCGFPAAVTYGSAGYFSSQTDSNGNVTHYTYDDVRGLETSRTEAYGTARARTTSTSWDPTFRLPHTITEPGRTTTYSYDSSGNVLTTTVADTTAVPNTSRVWSYTYNSFGQVLTEDGPRTDVSDVTTYTYYQCNTGAQCGQLHTVTNALGQVTTFNTYNADSLPLTVTDPNGVMTTLAYDARQRLISQQVGGELTRFDYWSTGLLSKITLPDGSALSYTYDDAHRLTAISDDSGNQIQYTLDVMGNRIAESIFDPSHTLSATRSRVYDALNRLSKDVRSAGTSEVTTSYTRDANGNITRADQPLARAWSSAYDELNRVTIATDAQGGTSTLAYDSQDNVVSVTDPRQLTTTYSYDGYGDPIQQVSPDSGSTARTFDSAGNLKTVTDARGTPGTYSYDALNRLTGITYPDQNLVFTYDQGTNGLGHLTGASDAHHTMSWSYDSQGRVVGVTQVVGALSRAVTYGYQAGNLTSVLTPSGQQISYTYSHGRVVGVAVNGASVLSDVLYSPFGAARQWIWSNGTIALRTYDLDGRPELIRLGDEPVEYSHDDASRIVGIRNLSQDSLSWTYGYDPNDRLTSAGHNTLETAWTYDADGNRSSDADTNTGQVATTTATVSGSSNQLISLSGARTNSYTFDAAGNLSAETNAHRPVVLGAAATVSYVYNALSQRVGKSGPQGPTYFVYDQSGRLLGEYGVGGVLIQETVWLDNLPIATLRPRLGGGIDVFYVHADHLGTPRKVTRPSDNVVVWRWDASPFGSELPNENPEGAGTFTFNLRLPGQYYDADTGLNYNYFRDYDAATGRYIQSDPIGLHGGLNTYAYGLGNPLSNRDPTGHFAIALPAAVIGIGAAIVCYVTNCAEGIENAIQAIQNASKDSPPVPPVASSPNNATPGDPCQLFPSSPECQQPPQPKSCPGSGRQFGKKFGEHLDATRVGYRTPQEYRDLANRVYNDASAIRTTYPSDADVYPGETHILDAEGNLLRLDPQGNFRSLYPKW